MSRTGRKPYYESDNPTTVVRGASWRAGVWIIGVVVFIGLIGIGIWGFRVSTADIKGQGDAHMKINSADNRLFAQGNFNDLYQEVLASDRKLDQAAQDVNTHPGDQFYATNYTGLMNHCQDTVAMYNSAARKITEARFRDADLPYQIDGSNPVADCKPTTLPSTGSAK